MKNLFITKSRIIIAAGFLLLTLGSFAKSHNKSNKVEKKDKSYLRSFTGVDGRKHHIHTAAHGYTTIYMSDLTTSEWFSLTAFVKETENEGVYHPEGKEPFVKIYLDKITVK